MEQYEDEEAGRARVLSNAQVLGFIAGYWLRRPLLASATVTLVLVAIGCELLIPTASQALINAIVEGPARAHRAWRAWAWLSVIYLGFVLSRNIAMRPWNRLAVRTMREMTNEAFTRVQAFSADWHADNFAGATVRRLTRAMWGYDAAADANLLGILPSLIILVGLSIQMLWRWPWLGAFALAVVVVFVGGNLVLNGLWAQAAYLKSVAMDSRIGGALADSISSNPNVKAFGAEAREEARIERVTTDWSTITQKAWMRFTDVWLWQNLLLAGLQAGLSGIMLMQWSLGKASAGDVAFIVTAFLVMSGYLRGVSDQVRITQRGLADVEDVARYARTPPQVADQDHPRPFRAGPGEIRFEDVTFAYKSAANRLYDHFDLVIKAGERVALVGPTGSGKSTFVKLLQRLYDLQAGRILIDGQDIAAVRQGELRRAIAVVPQDPALFHRSVAENIAYGQPGASMEAIALAAGRAHAHAFIAALPKGYDTLVGERGVKLSGGERQRVAIARAFLADAPVLVFDEATSSLDVETEAEVQAASEALMAGRTTIVIAHRLSTIRGADRILVFRNGKIVEEGRHADLLALGGDYARLHAASVV